jgi:transcriptional regulator with XRE-family HTH domain
MKDRIIRIMKEKNMNASQFSDAIGIQRATISHILAGRNNPSLDMVMKIFAKFPAISPDWFLFGKGSMNREQENNGVGTVLPGDLFPLPDFPLTAKTETKAEMQTLTKRTDDMNNTKTTLASAKNPKNTANIHTKPEVTGVNAPKDDVYNGKSNPARNVRETIVYRERPNKIIDKLLIFYSDNTFESFIPEKRLNDD